MAFVAEIRPRVRPLQTFYESPEGFVAELRPRNQAMAASPKSCHDDCQSMDYSDRDLFDALLEKKFSKESMTHLLEKSILTLVEKLLIDRSVESIEGRITVTLSDDVLPIVVQLNKHSTKPVTNNYDYLTELPSLNIKVRSHHHLQVQSPEMDAYPCMRQIEAVSPSNSYRDEGFSVCSPTSPQQLSPPQPLPSLYSPSHPSQSLPSSPQLSPAPSTPLSQFEEPFCTDSKGRRDSDEESGYTSTGKEDCDSQTIDPVPNHDIEDDAPGLKSQSVYNDYFCKGFDGSDTIVKPGLFLKIGDSNIEPSQKVFDKIDDEDVKYDEEARLVIDETPLQKSDEYAPMEIETSSPKLKDSAEVDESKGFSTLKPGTVDMSDEPSVSSSDATDIDTDAPVDLSGDSELSRGLLSVSPHPQSLVSKHPEGLKCKQCLTMMPADDGNAVARHALEEHNLYACNFCYRSFTAKNNLKRHVRLHTGSRPYRCTQCSQTFARRDDLKGHQLRHNYTKQFRCSICSKGYTDRACVKNHMAKEHRSRTMHVCPQCGESFDREDKFSAHKRSHPELQNFSCRQCSFIGTNNLMTLKHGLLHNYKLFSCKPCNAHFADAFDYTNHVRVHKNTPGFNQYVCCFCDLALSTYEQYVRHEYSHAQGKTHHCKICQKQFKSKSLLSSHMQTHNDEHFENVCKQEAASCMSEQAAVPQNAYCSNALLPNGVVETEGEEKYGGELLDLSMKKPSSPDFGRRDSLTTSLCSGQRLTGPAHHGAPRNGCVAVSFSQWPEQQAVEMSPLKFFDGPKLEKKTCRPIFSAHQENIPIVALDMLYKSQAPIRSLDTLSIHSKTFENINPIFPTRPKSTERGRQIAVGPSGEHKNFSRSNSNGYGSKILSRYSPYHRQKMVDLAAKYYAARGPKIVVTPSSKPERPVVAEQSALPVMVSQEEFQHSISHKRIEEIKACEHLNSETTSRHHMPAFVKSETMSENEAEEDFARPGSDAARNPEHFVAQNQKYGGAMDMSGPSTCEVCKESFGSFPELEAHSVEVHKRYLCEHCMKLFTTRPNRDRHARVHTGERPYKCDLCDLAFFRGDDLKYHRTTRHPSALPYVCSRCSTSFTWGRDLERHIRHAKCKM